MEPSESDSDQNIQSTSPVGPVDSDLSDQADQTNQDAQNEKSVSGISEVVSSPPVSTAETSSDSAEPNSLNQAEVPSASPAPISDIIAPTVSTAPPVISPSSEPTTVTASPSGTLANSTPEEPSPNTGAAEQPNNEQPIVVGSFAPTAADTSTNSASVTAAPKEPKPRKLRLLIAVVAVLALIILGSLGYYFGYYSNASYVYSQSLKNTGKASADLTTYADKPSLTRYKGVTGSGTYQVSGGSVNASGTYSLISDGTSSDVSASLKYGPENVTLEVRTIKSSSDKNPDIYLKADGISGLGSLIGDPSLDTTINPLDGKWIAIDHSILDQLQSKLGMQAGTMMTTMPTKAQLISASNAFNAVNQRYLFSTSSSTAVTHVVKTYGKETIDGNKTIHYLVDFNKAHLKAYVTAQKNALLASSLNSWITENNYTSDVNQAYASLEKAAGQVTPSDTIQVWSNISTRLIYKVRVSVNPNPLSNYVDLGLNYKSGDTLPFFLNAVSESEGKKTTINLNATFNTKSNNLIANLKAQGSGTGGQLITAGLNVTPTLQAPVVTAPVGSEPLSQVLNSLGLGEVLSEYLQATGSSGSTLD